MKIDDLKTKHESDRIVITLGIIATYIALFSIKKELPFDIEIVFDTSGYILTYLAGYLMMTAFCYRHDNTYTESLMRSMDAFRKHYYDIGATFLPIVFYGMIIWSFSDNPWIRTIGILIPSLIFIIKSYKEFRCKTKNTKKTCKQKP